MKQSKQTLFQKTFCDADGNMVVAQFPNAPLVLWLTLSLVRLFPFSSQIDSGLAALANACLFVWAYLEITDGVNYFRRALGATIMAFMVVSYFS